MEIQAFYFDKRYGNIDIFMMDLTTNTETRIISNSASQPTPGIYGTKIVWRNDDVI
jgi:Tol biopolymer transport system component